MELAHEYSFVFVLASNLLVSKAEDMLPILQALVTDREIPVRMPVAMPMERPDRASLPPEQSQQFPL
jgi:hypothetical protein